MVKKIVQKWGIIQIRTLAKNGGIIQIAGKYDKFKMGDNAKNVGEFPHWVFWISERGF